MARKIAKKKIAKKKSAAKPKAAKPKESDVCTCGHVEPEHEAAKAVCKFAGAEVDPCECVGFEKGEG